MGLRYLKTIGTFKINSHTNFCEFSALEGIFVIYKSKEDYPLKYKQFYPLNSIYKVNTWEDSSKDKSKWFSSKNSYSFDFVDTNSTKTTFYSKNFTGIKFWVEVMQKAKTFHKWFSFIKAWLTLSQSEGEYNNSPFNVR